MSRDRAGHSAGAAFAAGVAAMVVAVAMCWVLASAAWGAHGLGGLIGGSLGAAADQFGQPRDIAVFEGTDANPATDKIVVVDDLRQRVVVLDGNGSFERLWGRNTIAFGAPGDLGDVPEVCVAVEDCQQPVVDKGGRAGEFADLQGVAVDQDTGLIYVADRHNRRVQVFDLNGVFKRMWGFDVVDGVGHPGAANDNGTGFEVCDVDAGNAAGECKAGLEGPGLGQLGSGALANTFDIAVSPPDGNPATGKVFVADSGNRRVAVYDLDGSSPSTIGSAVQFGLNQPRKLAVSGGGVLYASDSLNSGEIERYDLDGDVHPSTLPGFLAPITAANSTPTSGPLLAGASTPGGEAAAATLGLEIDPASGALYVMRDPASGASVVQELAAPGVLVPPAVASDVHGTGVGLGAVNGMGFSPTRDYFYVGDLVTTTFTGLFVLSESPGVLVDVVANTPTMTGSGSALLSGSVDPNEGVVSYRFEISADGTTYEPVGHRRYVSGAGAQPVSAEVSELQPATFYAVRLVASKQTTLSTQATVISPVVNFLTPAAPPDVVTLGSAGRTDVSAQLRARVDPNGSATTYRFEYGGAGSSLSLRAPVLDASAGSGNAPQLVAEQVDGLIPDTAYEYRIVAENASGTSVGDRVEFRTLPAREPDVSLGARAYELVSPADKLSGTGVGEWYGGPGSIGGMGFAAHEGERFAARGATGSVLLDSAFSYANDWAFADRLSDQSGWRSHSPFTHASPSGQTARFTSINAASDDLSRAAWGTNNASLTVFPEMVGFPIEIVAPLISDWEGRWEILAPTDLDAQLDGPLAVSGDGELCDMVFSADGSTVVCSTDFGTFTGRSLVRGLAGPGDPTSKGRPDLVGGRSVYAADLSDGLADNFAGAGERTLVNVCTEGTVLPEVDGAGLLSSQPCPSPLPGSDHRLVSDRGAAIQLADSEINIVVNNTRGVVSEDGKRVFFMAPDPLVADVPNGVSSFCDSAGDVCPPQLFVRQTNPNGSVVTRWISRAQDGLFGTQAATLAGPAIFEGATPDGDKVFFRSNSPLTADDPNQTGAAPVTDGTADSRSWDLYMYDLPDSPGADPADGELSRISAGPDGEGDCNGAQASSSSFHALSQGILRFVSNDGRRVYFACAGALDGVPSPSSSGTLTDPGGDASTTATTNLYLYDETQPIGAQYRFVTRLPRATGDGIDSCATTGVSQASPMQEAGPSGRGGYGFLTTVNCVRGRADGGFITFWTAGRLTVDDPDTTSADVYGYDADRDELSRISAPQGGVGGSYPCGDQGAAATLQCNGDGGFDWKAIAAFRPVKSILGVATHPAQPGDRIAFFQSRSRLIAADVDNEYDVYQWRNGKLSLISTGSSGTHGAFLRGSDSAGRNVYLATEDRLTWQDHDSVFDIYTARVDGGIVQPPLPSTCDALVDGCKSGLSGSPNAVDVSSTGPGSAGRAAVRRLTVSGLSRKARLRASRSGVLPLRIRSSVTGRIGITVKGRVGKARRVVARRSVRVREPGALTVRMVLSSAARRSLRSGRKMRLTVRVRQVGVGTRTRSILLPGVKS
jgi:hypothetical protein